MTAAAARMGTLFINLSIAVGLTFAAMLLLRPLLKRLLSPQQRAWLWVVGWLPAYMGTLYGLQNMIHLLPVTFRDLITPRTGGSGAYDVPAYFPKTYAGPGPYHLALPGGALLRVELTDALVTGVTLLWLIGVVAMLVLFLWKDHQIHVLLRQGEEPLPLEPWLRAIPELKEKRVCVRLCDGLDTSFLYGAGPDGWTTDRYRYTICLQRELPPERRELVLRHELEHIRLHHLNFKVFANCAMILHWWNPVVWLAHKYFCQDLELACDRAVLDRLEPEGRREYARTLVELGAGRQLWDAPLGFGECDTKIRVRAAAAWKKQGRIRQAAGWTALVLLVLFFLGGPEDRYLPQDALLLWERRGGTVDSLVEDISSQISDQEPQEIWAVNDDNRCVIFYVRLTDGTWRQLLYFIVEEHDMMHFYKVNALPGPESFEGMYRVL